MRYRKFVLVFSALILLFVGANCLVWNRWTEDLLTNTRYQGGDLARMGYIYRCKDFRSNNTDLPRRHLDIKDYDGRKIDMLTIGDSFSNGGGGGRNRFYQDYIASIDNMEVLNIPRYKDLTPLESVSIFCNNGLLDRIKPRYLLIGVAEKAALDMAAPIDFSRTISQERLKGYTVNDFYTPFPSPPRINNGNAKFLLYNALYQVSNHAVIGSVYIHPLSATFFTVPDGNHLFALNYKLLSTPAVIAGLNANLNGLSDKLAAKGIKLVFMPCVEKLTLYSDYVVNSPHPKSRFFEQLRELPKRYSFIDTKALLGEELRKGEKDIFYADDTHWSWKAPSRIFSAVRFP